MLRLSPRGTASDFWRYAAPVLALALTALITGGIFAFMGRPPVLTVTTFLITPPIDGQLLEFNGSSSTWTPLFLGGDVRGAPASLAVYRQRARDHLRAILTRTGDYEGGTAWQDEKKTIRTH